jgi:hypothetical protein
MRVSNFNLMTRLGLEQDELKSIMQDILEMDLNNDWEVRREGGGDFTVKNQYRKFETNIPRK